MILPDFKQRVQILTDLLAPFTRAFAFTRLGLNSRLDLTPMC